MNKRTAGFAALLALAATPGAAQESAKIGFVSTFSGPAAAIGNDMRDGFELALDHLGRKVGGLPAQVIYEDGLGYDGNEARSDDGNAVRDRAGDVKGFDNAVAGAHEIVV